MADPKPADKPVADPAVAPAADNPDNAPNVQPRAEPHTSAPSQPMDTDPAARRPFGRVPESDAQRAARNEGMLEREQLAAERGGEGARLGTMTDPATKQPVASGLPVIDSEAARRHFAGGSSQMSAIVLALCDFYDGAVRGDFPGDR